MKKPEGLQAISDKFFNEFPAIKKDKKLVSFLRDFMLKELDQCYPLLHYTIIIMENKKILNNLKQLFFDPDWLSVNKAPVTFRLELKKYMYQLYQLKLNLLDVMEEEGEKFKNKKTKIITDNSYKNKSVIQLEMEKLQIRRMTIFGEKVDSPQGIIYVLAKIFLKTLKEYIKVKKFSFFAYKQIQVDVSFVHSFLKEQLIYIDTENILDGFFSEIMMNAEVNTIEFDPNGVLGNDFINDVMKMHKAEFDKVLKKTQDANNIIRVPNAGE